MTLLEPLNVKYPSFKALEGKRGLVFDVVPSNFEEDYEKSTFPNPTAYCSATCAQKAKIVLEKTIHDANPPSLVISSDTIVVCDGIIYEKPMDRTDAVRILTAISGKTVDLVTAVTMLFRKDDGGYEDVSFEETTEMYMEEYGSDMINAYLNTGESWMGFSGAFSYQSAALLMITGITGCFYNAIGFPCSRFYKEFKKISSRVH